MRGCGCATCEAQREYDRRRNLDPKRVVARRVASVAARTRSEEAWARHLATIRRCRRRQADARDAARLAELYERNSQS